VDRPVPDQWTDQCLTSAPDTPTKPTSHPWVHRPVSTSARTSARTSDRPDPDFQWTGPAFDIGRPVRQRLHPREWTDPVPGPASDQCSVFRYLNSKWTSVDQCSIIGAGPVRQRSPTAPHRNPPWTDPVLRPVLPPWTHQCANAFTHGWTDQWTDQCPTSAPTSGPDQCSTPARPVRQRLHLR
jgi:hypothetical protein